MKFRFLLLISVLCVCVPPDVRGGSTLIPERGETAVAQRARDLRGNLSVMSIAMRPGDEDCATLAYLRLHLGARLLSVYVTNGEAGESDAGWLYPAQLAALRRVEAATAMRELEAEAFFLNLPDIVVRRDTVRARAVWDSDTLQSRLKQLMAFFKPDIVLVAREWATHENHMLRAILLEGVLDAAATLPAWRVQRIAAESPPGRTSYVVPVNVRHPSSNRTYASIGEEIVRRYASLRNTIPLRERRSSAYVQIHPHDSGRGLLEGATFAIPPRLKALDGQVRQTAMQAGRSGKGSRTIWRSITALLDSIETTSRRYADLDVREVSYLVHRRLAAERLLNALLGVEVRFTMPHTIVAPRQLIELAIDTVHSHTSLDDLTVYFPQVRHGWVINESTTSSYPLTSRQTFRLLSPGNAVLTYPHAFYGLDKKRVGEPLTFVVTGRDRQTGVRFSKQLIVPIEVAPRFTVEVLTPIVRAVNGEKVVVRLTNNTWDGLKDKVAVDDSLASSGAHEFRLPTKGTTHLDTLRLTWERTPDPGTYLIPISIDDHVVAHVAARSFDVRVDSTRRVALVRGAPDSPTAAALSRLGLLWRALDSIPADGLKETDVVIIDRRAMTLNPSVTAMQLQLQAFVQNGGHLVIFGQDVRPWNATPLWDAISLSNDDLLDELSEVTFDATHPIVQSPNAISADDFDGWLYRRGYSFMKTKHGSSTTVVAADGSPQVVTGQVGKGHITYADLALQHQLLDVNAGAHRIFANIVSYR